MRKTHKEIIWAIHLNDIRTVRRLIKNTPTVLKKAGAEALVWAAKLGRVKITEILLKAGVDPDSSWGNVTALQWAVGGGGKDRMDVARMLLEKGANTRGALACACRFPNMVELLLAHGADAKDARCDGVTALMWAASNGTPETVRLLLKYGADINATDFAGETALHYATHCSYTVGCLERIQELIKAGADVNARSNSGVVPVIPKQLLNISNKPVEVYME